MAQENPVPNVEAPLLRPVSSVVSHFVELGQNLSSLNLRDPPDGSSRLNGQISREMYHDLNITVGQPNLLVTPAPERLLHSYDTVQKADQLKKCVIDNQEGIVTMYDACGKDNTRWASILMCMTEGERPLVDKNVSPLKLACRFTNFDIVNNHLLKHLSAQDRRKLLNEVTSNEHGGDGRSCVNFAVEHNNHLLLKEMLKADLVDLGNRVKISSPLPRSAGTKCRNGDTILHTAARLKDPTCFEAIVELVAEEDLPVLLKKQNSDSHCPLWLLFNNYFSRFAKTSAWSVPLPPCMAESLQPEVLFVHKKNSREHVELKPLEGPLLDRYPSFGKVEELHAVFNMMGLLKLFEAQSIENRGP